MIEIKINLKTINIHTNGQVFVDGRDMHIFMWQSELKYSDKYGQEIVYLRDVPIYETLFLLKELNKKDLEKVKEIQKEEQKERKNKKYHEQGYEIER